MIEKLQEIKEGAIKKISEVSDLKKLDEIRVAFLGKKGELTSVLRGMKDLTNDERPLIGKLANEVRELIEDELEKAKKGLSGLAREHQLKTEFIDVTMPAKRANIGHRHPMNVVLDDLKNIFIGMGYSIAEGPEIENDYYNFEALNIPENHAARDEQDTFYINKDIMLRTATSPVQVRVMENNKPPIRIIAPGRVYRSDEVDATHSPVFHQVEGLVIDKGVTMADLKGALAEFARELYGEKVKVKFRPHYFPFTEPSAEMDVSCVMCGGEGCRICRGSGWIEVLGCGMVHPKVLEMSGIDPNEYSGFAFGMGLERITMLRYGIEDLRLFYENDIRFLKQF
ncbi:MAG: phenylalanine--tRNA ligase subunit alpha [Firmicutes bacterium HGW-Firmicutes-7]|nr:MAG: phenylalanine--tRNA ligase subunit alpha [Firmicutes bacterium HGW-Firmicutes-7]